MKSNHSYKNLLKLEEKNSPFKKTKVEYLNFAPQLLKTCLNRDRIASNLSVTGIQVRHENALIQSLEMSPLLIYL